MKREPFKKRYIILFILLILLIISYVYLFTGVYEADFQLDEFKSSHQNIRINEYQEYISLSKNNNSDTALIFYPGGKVDENTYIPFLSEIVQNGYDVFIAKMPFDLAVLGVDKASVIIESENNYTSFYIGGHSLGGVMANRFALKHTDTINGVVFYASYPDKKMSENSSAILMYGSLDNVLDIKKMNENLINLPNNSSILVIDGGNHSQFGDYGNQKGDGTPSISKLVQQKTAALTTVEFLNSNK